MTKHFSDEYILDCRITTNKPTYLKNKVELVFEEYAIENGKKSFFRVIHNGKVIKRFNRKTISPEILETFIKIAKTMNSLLRGKRYEYEPIQKIKSRLSI